MELSALFWLVYGLSLLFVPVVITKKKRPLSAVAWILAILLLPALGVLLFFIFGTDRIVNKGRQKFFANKHLRQKLQHLERVWSPAEDEKRNGSLAPEHDEIRRICKHFGLFDAVGNNRIELLVDGDAAYAKMTELIEEARDHINLESYIFLPDETGTRFRDLLVRKAKHGVQVNLLYDAIGSSKLGWDWAFLRPLRDAGIEPQDFLPLRTFFKPWNMNLRNHRKILVIDGEAGFTGSLNIGSEFLNDPARHNGRRWRETHALVRGPVVAQLQWIFCEDWYFATGEALTSPGYFQELNSAGDDIVQVVASGPDAREEAIQKAFVMAISQAKESVFLTTPYFIPDAALNLALQLAALRGVDVCLMIPHKSDHRYVTLAGQSYFDELLQHKVRICSYTSGFIHAKMLIVDGSFVTIGSANVDLRSFSYNFEVNLQIFSCQVGRRAEEIFRRDLQDCTELDASSYGRRSAVQRFGENLCRLFSPLL